MASSARIERILDEARDPVPAEPTRGEPERAPRAHAALSSVQSRSRSRWVALLSGWNHSPRASTAGGG